MGMENRVESLRQRHASLEARIAEEEARPYPDEIQLKRLKTEKLRLKDEIAACSSAEVH